MGRRDDGAPQQELLVGQFGVGGTVEGAQPEHRAHRGLQLAAEGVVGALGSADLLLDGEQHLDILHRQDVLDHQDVDQVADLVPGIFFADRVGDKTLFDIVADHGAGQLDPAEGAEMTVHILDGLVEVQPHPGQLCVPGQGKARGRGRYTAFRFFIHGLSIHRNARKSRAAKTFC